MTAMVVASGSMTTARAQDDSVFIDKSVFDQLDSKNQKEAAFPSTSDLILAPEKRKPPLQLSPPGTFPAQRPGASAGPTVTGPIGSPLPMYTTDGKVNRAAQITEARKNAARGADTMTAPNIVHKDTGFVETLVAAKPTPPPRIPPVPKSKPVAAIQQAMLARQAAEIAATPKPAPAPVEKIASAAPDLNSIQSKIVIDKTPERPEIFPVKTRVQSAGELDPAASASTKGTVPPENIIGATTTKTDAPVPARRPDKAAQKKELVDSYTVVRNEGAKMPAIAKPNVKREDLAAPQRLTVDDIAGDPLASQLVDMSPQEIAEALNKIAPAASSSVARELKHGTKPPRIVRMEGEWIRKSKEKPAAIKTDENGMLITAPKPDAEAAKDTEPQIAAITAPLAPAPEGITNTKGPRADLSLPFSIGQVDLGDELQKSLNANLLPVLKDDKALRIQILAYSSATDGREMSARRTALSRALAIRSHLIAKGIDSTRLDVRAIGMNPDQGAAPDKVDIVVETSRKS